MFYSAFDVVVMVGAYVTFIYGAASLACGLYTLADAVEERASLARRVFRAVLVVVLVANLVVWLFDQPPLLCGFSGVAAHALYLAVMRRFPVVEVKTPEFIGAALMMVLQHVAWFQYFGEMFETPARILFYFVPCVWTGPLLIVVSLSANDNTLPTMLQQPASGEERKPNRRVQLILALFRRIPFFRSRQPTLPHQS